MANLEIGDIVTRQSYNNDIYFKIIDIKIDKNGNKVYVLKGTNFRIIADSKGDDLREASFEDYLKQKESGNKRIDEIVNSGSRSLYRGEDIKSKKKSSKKSNKKFGHVATVLHIDGDEEYLAICLRTYEAIGIKAYGHLVPEIEQSRQVQELLERVKPDILVLTGHDSVSKDCKDYKDVNSYRNSKYFAEAVRKAREFEPAYDELVIFAGACQSYYEEIIGAGANYATSPYRILVHALDPVLICEKVAFTSISKFLSPKDVVQNTITGEKGVGGLETRGKYREGSPPSPYS